MPDYVERMATLARNVEDGRIGVVLAILARARQRRGAVANRCSHPG
jgi:hypothetical protein